MAQNDPAVTVLDDGLSVKFYQTLKAIGITNANFKIFLDQATPAEVVGALKTINVSEDYNSISRTLKLYFAIALTPNTNYFVRISGLKDTSGANVPSVDYHFSITGVVPDYGDLVPPDEPVLVEDRSIIEIFGSDVDIIEAYNPDFFVSGHDPSEPFVESDENAGRVTLKFSVRPAETFVNARYFKAQRKQISRTVTRWQNLAVHISSDGDRPWVYIDFPSLDATPVYDTSGREYFEDGYKYRIKISKDVGT